MRKADHGRDSGIMRGSNITSWTIWIILWNCVRNTLNISQKFCLLVVEELPTLLNHFYINLVNLQIDVCKFYRLRIFVSNLFTVRLCILQTVRLWSHDCIGYSSFAIWMFRAFLFSRIMETLCSSWLTQSIMVQKTNTETSSRRIQSGTKYFLDRIL